MKPRNIMIFCIMFLSFTTLTLADFVIDSPENYSTSVPYVTVKEFFFPNPVNVSKHEFQTKTANGGQSVAISTTFNYTDGLTQGFGLSAFDTVYTTYTANNPNQSKLVNYIKIQLGSAGGVGAYIQLSNITYDNYFTFAFVDPTPEANAYIRNNLTINVSALGSERNHTVIKLYNDTDQTNLIQTDEFIGDDYPSVFYDDTIINISKYGDVYYVNVTHTDTNNVESGLARKFNYFRIEDCNIVGGTPVLTFNIQNENNETPLNGTIFVDILTSEGIATNIERNNTQILELCFDSSDIVTLDATVNNDVAFRHNYYIYSGQVSTSNPQEINVYNYPTTTGISTLQQLVQDLSFGSKEGITVKMERKYPPLNTYKVVQMDVSDSNGQVIFHIIQEDITYRFKYYLGNTLLSTTNDFKFICDSGLCSILKRVDTEAGTPSDNLVVTSSYTNTTDIITIDWNDNTGITSYIDMYVLKQTLGGQSTICSQKVYSASGTFLCNVSLYTGTIFVEAYGSESVDQPIYLQVYNLQGDMISSYLPRQDQWFYGFLILITFIIMGMASTTGVLIMMVGAMIFISMMGISSTIGTTFVVVVALMSITIGALVRGKI